MLIIGDENILKRLFFQTPAFFKLDGDMEEHMFFQVRCEFIEFPHILTILYIDVCLALPLTKHIYVNSFNPFSS